jgi:hypothetical protein
LVIFGFTRDSKSPVFKTQRVQDLFLPAADDEFQLFSHVSLKEATRFYGLFGAWSGLTPDGYPLFVRDISNQEIYALDWRLL